MQGLSSKSLAVLPDNSPIGTHYTPQESEPFIRLRRAFFPLLPVFTRTRCRFLALFPTNFASDSTRPSYTHPHSDVCLGLPAEIPRQGTELESLLPPSFRSFQAIFYRSFLDRMALVMLFVFILAIPGLEDFCVLALFQPRFPSNGCSSLI